MLFSSEPREGLCLKWAQRGDDGVGAMNTAIDSGNGPAGSGAIELVSDRIDARLECLTAGPCGLSWEMT